MGGQLHAPATLSLGKRPGANCTEGWVGSWASLDGCGKPRPPPPPGFDALTIQYVASRYTDYANPARDTSKLKTNLAGFHVTST
jgi:hypothetical protein